MGKDAAQASSLTSADAGTTAPRDEAIQQLVDGVRTDGSIFQQLASNPFFTAVCVLPFPRQAIGR